jgi:formate/nitrite transporter FocA (FNT family)
MDDSGDVDYLRGVRVSLIFKVVVFNNIITCLGVINSPRIYCNIIKYYTHVRYIYFFVSNNNTHIIYNYGYQRNNTRIFNKYHRRCDRLL